MGIAAHLKYLSYVLRHKWCVGEACFAEGLYWRGLKHDISKFSIAEWFPYVEAFYGKKNKIKRDETGYYDPNKVNNLFDHAWLHHQKCNDHHWQWWVLPEDSGVLRVIPMTDVAIHEMLCDWYGASMAQGMGGWPSVLKWWNKNRIKMTLTIETIRAIEILLEARCP